MVEKSKLSMPDSEGAEKVVDSEGEKAHVSPITEANVAPERNDAQVTNFSLFLSLPLHPDWLYTTGLHYTNKLIYLEQAAKWELDLMQSEPQLVLLVLTHCL